MARILSWMRTHAVGIRSIAWLVLSIIAFVIAGHYTRKISHVEPVVSGTEPQSLWHNPKGFYEIGILAPSGTQGVVEVHYDRLYRDDLPVLELRLPKGIEKLLVYDMYKDGCRYGDPAARDYSKWQVLAYEYVPELSEAIVDVSRLVFDYHHVVACDVVPHELPETFTTTVTRFVNYSKNATRIPQLEALPYRLRVENRMSRSEIISSDDEISETGIIVYPGHGAAVRLWWIPDEERRDVYLVIIGSFVAFGATFFVESLRPLIDRIGTAKRGPSGV